MSLKVKPVNTYKARIEVTLADGEQGDFSAEFNYLTRTQLDELLAENLRDAEVIDRVLAGAIGISDEDGNALSPEAAKLLVKENIALSQAVVRGFFVSIGGAPAKNSKTSPQR